MNTVKERYLAFFAFVRANLNGWLFSVVCASVATEAHDSNFDLFFQRRSDVDHALLFMPPCSLQAFTACLWLRVLLPSVMMTLFSYATPAHHNAIIGALTKNEDFFFAVNSNSYETM